MYIHHKKFYWNPSMRKMCHFYFWFCTFEHKSTFLWSKNDTFCAWRDFNKKICDVCTYIKWNFKPQISPIFHIEYVNQVWISGVLGVKADSKNSIFVAEEKKTYLYVYNPKVCNFGSNGLKKSVKIKSLRNWKSFCVTAWP